MKLMGSLIFILTFLSPAMALTLDDLSMASKDSTSYVEALYGQQSVFSYRVRKTSHDAEVDVLTQFEGDNFVVMFDCHEHGNHFDCHESGEYPLSPMSETVLPLSLLREGERASFQLVSQRLRAELQSYTIWGVRNHDVGHGSEDEVWIRFDFFKGENARHFYVWCHEHSHESFKSGDLDCHVETKAPFEPTYK